MQKINIGIIVGDNSGDKIGYKLLRNIVNKNTNIIGVFGPMLRKICNKQIFSMEQITTFGLIDPFKNLTKLLNSKNILIKSFSEIDIFIGIDFSGFNLIIENTLKKKGVIVFHIVSPTIWAWRKNRIKKILNSINLIFLIYFFEKTIYKLFKIPFFYIGHPLFYCKKKNIYKNFLKLKLKIKKEDFIVCFLPGSRLNEVKYHLLIYYKFFIFYKLKNCFFSIVNFNFLRKGKNLGAKDIVSYPYYKIIKISDIIFCASGTALLESCFLKKNAIVNYKLDELSYFFLKLFLKIRYISIYNIISKKKLINEIIQKKFNTSNLLRNLVLFLDGRNKLTFKKKFCLIDKINKKLEYKTNKNFEDIMKKFFLY